MPDSDQVKLLRSGVDIWNRSRPDVVEMSEARLRNLQLPGVNLRDADLCGADLRGADLYGADLQGANLSRCDLRDADLRSADLSGAKLCEARLRQASLQNAKLLQADLSGSDLSEVDARKASFRKSKLDGAWATKAQMGYARFSEASLVALRADSSNLRGATLLKADLSQANLAFSDLTGADMRKALLVGANLYDAKLSEVNLTLADLSGADLRRCTFVETVVTDCILAGSSIYGISVWGTVGKPADQRNLLLSFTTYYSYPVGSNGQPIWDAGRFDRVTEIRVDDLEVAQFIYLLLNREKLRNVIDTITSKAVLILGRFTPDRKVVLDAMANELRDNNLIPIIFDFEHAEARDFTETIKTLAGMSFFVIVDITNPKSAPLELQATVPNYQIPFIPIIQQGETPFSMFNDLRKYDWVLKPLVYPSLAALMNVFKIAIIDEAFAMHKKLLRRKAEKVEIRSVDDYLRKSD